jgi:hypothetical protein
VTKTISHQKEKNTEVMTIEEQDKEWNRQTKEASERFQVDTWCVSVADYEQGRFMVVDSNNFCYGRFLTREIAVDLIKSIQDGTNEQDWAMNEDDWQVSTPETYLYVFEGVANPTTYFYMPEDEDEEATSTATA